MEWNNNKSRVLNISVVAFKMIFFNLQNIKTFMLLHIFN